MSRAQETVAVGAERFSETSRPRSQGVSSSRHYETLDALRGVAALAVMLLHGRYYFWDSLGASAYLAVDFFFMLSGFVVAYAYENKLRAGMSRREFLLLRVVRLYPLYLAGLLFALFCKTVATYAGDDRLSFSDIELSFVIELFFLPSPFNGSFDRLFPLNSPAWSLFFEVVINIVYGLLHRWLSTSILIAVVVVAALGLGAQALSTGTTDTGHHWANIAGGPARVFFAFPLGVLLFRARDSFPAILGRLSPWPLLILLFALLMLPVEKPWRALYDLEFLFLVAPLLVVGGTQAVASASQRRFFLLLGLLSFPLYALHFPVIDPTVTASKRLGVPLPLTGVAYIVGAVTLAWAAARADVVVRRRLLARLAPRRSGTR